MPPPFDLLPKLLPGLAVTLELALGGILVAVFCSLSAGLARVSHSRILRAAAGLYVESFRGTSALVQLFWFYFALPFFGVELTAKAAGILVLGLNAGSYGAEVVRGAVGAVPSGQWEGSVALNLSRRQALRFVVLPQALRAILPPAGNLAIELLKNTSLVSLITLSELTFRGQTLRAASLRTVEIFSWILLLYFLCALAVTAGVRALERRVGRGFDAGRTL